MRLLALAFLAALAASLSACGRPLTTAERAFMADLQGESFNAARARLHNGALVGSVTFRRKARPRLSCKERLFPPAQGEIVTTSPAAVALFSHIYFAKDYFSQDYMRGYPSEMNLYAAMLFAHEMTHIWQWQNRRTTGYHPLKAASEHGALDDPYLFDVSTKTRLLDHGYEQQAAIVEEYVCCAALDPTAPRTKRLETLLREAFPLGRLRIPPNPRLPWEGAQTKGICR